MYRAGFGFLTLKMARGVHMKGSGFSPFSWEHGEKENTLTMDV